jgi:hypothetical protein
LNIEDFARHIAEETRKYIDARIDALPLVQREADISVEFDGERSLTVAGKSFTLPIHIYRGVFTEGQEYKAHDTVTFKGSLWVCKEATTNLPPGPSEAWQLIVKRGKDGSNAEK